MAGLDAIATERLRGERLGPRHVDVLLPIFADPRVGETMGGVSDRERVEEEHGFGYWLWFETATGEPVARGGLSHTESTGDRSSRSAGRTARGDAFGPRTARSRDHPGSWDCGLGRGSAASAA